MTVTCRYFYLYESDLGPAWSLTRGLDVKLSMLYLSNQIWGRL